MPRKTPTKRVGREHATKYLAKAQALLADARNQVDLITEFHAVGIGIVIVHCAISFSDALCVRAAGHKSRSGEHRDAVELVKAVLRTGPADDRPLKDLGYLIGIKDEIAYGDAVFSSQDAREWLRRLERVAAWAEKRYATLA